MDCASCPSRNSLVIDREQGIVVCSDCGVVAEEQIIDESAPYSKTVSHRLSDPTPSQISEKFGDYIDEGLQKAGITVSSDVVALAETFKNRVDPKHRGERRNGFLLACLHQAAKENGVALEIRILSGCFDTADVYIHAGLEELAKNGVVSPVAAVSSDIPFLARTYALRLDLPHPMVVDAERIARAVSRAKRRNPKIRPCRSNSVAAGCIWRVLCDNHATRTGSRELLERVTGVSKTTFNLVYSHIKDIDP